MTTQRRIVAAAPPIAESVLVPIAANRSLNSLQSALHDDGLGHPSLVDEDRAAAQCGRHPGDAPEVRTQGKVAGRGADDQRRTKARGQFRLRNCNRRAAAVRAIDHVYRHAVQCHVLYASCDDEMERRIEWEPPERAWPPAPRDEGNWGGLENDPR